MLLIPPLTIHDCAGDHAVLPGGGAHTHWDSCQWGQGGQVRGGGGSNIKIWNLRQQNSKQVAEFDEGEGVTNILVTEEEEEERENIVEL